MFHETKSDKQTLCLGRELKNQHQFMFTRGRLMIYMCMYVCVYIYMYITYVYIYIYTQYMRTVYVYVYMSIRQLICGMLVWPQSDHWGKTLTVSKSRVTSGKHPLSFQILPECSNCRNIHQLKLFHGDLICWPKAMKFLPTYLRLPKLHRTRKTPRHMDQGRPPSIAEA